MGLIARRTDIAPRSSYWGAPSLFRAVASEIRLFLQREMKHGPPFAVLRIADLDPACVTHKYG